MAERLESFTQAQLSKHSEENIMSTEPTQTCVLCGRVVRVDSFSRGYPPEAAARKLKKICKANGCPSQPQYLAGFGPSTTVRAQ